MVGRGAALVCRGCKNEFDQPRERHLTTGSMRLRADPPLPPCAVVVKSPTRVASSVWRYGSAKSAWPPVHPQNPPLGHRDARQHTDLDIVRCHGRYHQLANCEESRRFEPPDEANRNIEWQRHPSMDLSSPALCAFDDRCHPRHLHIRVRHRLVAPAESLRDPHICSVDRLLPASCRHVSRSFQWPRA